MDTLLAQFSALKYRLWMSLSRVISNANNFDNARATPSDAAPAFSRTTERALHFTIPPVIACRTYVYVYVHETYVHTRFHAAEDEIHPVYVRRTYEGYILCCGPLIYYLRSLLMARHDLPPHPSHFSSRNLYTSYSNKSQFGSSMRVDVHFPGILLDITGTTYDRVSLNSLMEPMLFN